VEFLIPVFVDLNACAVEHPPALPRMVAAPWQAVMRLPSRERRAENLARR